MAGISAPSVKEIFETMSYGPAPEAKDAAEKWLANHDHKLGHFIGGKWTHPEGRKTYETKCPATGQVLASTTQGTQEDVDAAVDAAKNAHVTWSRLAPHARARHLYAVARHVQKHQRLISVVESLDNGKSIRETRDADIPLVVRHFYHHAGWAQLMDVEMKEWKSLGVVGAIVPWNFPLMLLTWKLCPALAMGNVVVLKPATYTRLSALLLAEICAEAGLPPGVFNVITGPGSMGSMLASHPAVDKVAFTGSTPIGQLLRKATAGSGKKLSLELGGKSPVVVYESADLDSVVEGVVDAIFFNQGEVCSAGSRLLVQHTVFDALVEKIMDRMTKLRLGDSLDKAIDMGPIVDESQRRTIEEYVEGARAEGASVFQVQLDKVPGKSGLFYPPTLITKVETTSRVVMEEIFGPVLVALPFRTAKEGIELANNTNYGLGSSVWTEKISLALETAVSLKAGAVWINCHNLFDAAAGFGGYKESGYGRDGGKEGLYEYVRPRWEDRPRPVIDDSFDYKTFGAHVPSIPASAPAAQGVAAAAFVGVNGGAEEAENGETGSDDDDGGGVDCGVEGGVTPSIDRTYKLYYGGAQKRPDGMYSAPVTDHQGVVVAHVADANRKDVRNAVDSALKAAPGWGKRAAHNRAQIVYYLAENLELRAEEFAKQISRLTGCPLSAASNEVTLSIDRLFHWGAFCDKYGGTIQETTLYGVTAKIHEPVGVIAITCPDESPLLSFVSLLAPAIVRGNAVVIVPSERFPLPALDLYQVFETSDLPGGVVNILTGNADHITKTLAEHQEINAAWYFRSAEGSKFVEFTSAENLKRTFVSYGFSRDWTDAAQGQGEEFLFQATQCKNIWIPMGDIFAN